jgi:CheY-like chemotaxis protein
MSRILLVDDSPHAQRMGERILTEEGYEVVTVSNADSALIRLDAVMPGRTGYDICQFLKMSPRHRHVRVILTAGVLEEFDEVQAKRAEADSTLKKPFEASALLAAVRPLADAAAKARAAQDPAVASVAPRAVPSAPFVAVVDAEQLRAAVTVALDASMDSIVGEITRRVVTALQSRKPDAAPAPSTSIAQPEPPKPAAPAAAPLPGRVEPVRRVSPLRLRSGSMLGLDIGRPETPPE